MTWSVPVDPAGAFVDGPGVLLAGAPGGVLAGTTLAVKDVVDVVGRVTGAGNPTIAATTAPAGRSAAVVERLVAAGASVVGRTVTDELAYSLDGVNVHLGAPRNPTWPDHATGGSSSGSAAAVGAGAADLGLGTDTGGSLRVPASYCRLLAWRPTHGSVPVTGVVPLAPSFDTVGLLAGAGPAGAELLATAATTLLGDGDGARHAEGSDAEVQRLVLAVDLLALVDADDRAAVEAAAERLADVIGVPLVRQTLLPGPTAAEAAAAFRALQGAEAWSIHGHRVATLDLGSTIAERFAAASRVTADEVAAARPVRAAVVAAVAAATDGGAVVVQPAAAGPPPRLGPESPAATEARRQRTMALTAPAGLAGAPVAVGPTRAAPAPPLGVALVGGPGADLAVLGLLRHLAPHPA